MKNLVVALLCLCTAVSVTQISSCKSNVNTAPAPEISEETEETPESDTFTIAIVPDSQQEVVVQKAIDDEFSRDRMEYLAENKDELNLKFVIHTGDMLNWDTPDHAQYKIASDALNVLDYAEIPYALCLGNHDTAATGVGGSAADPDNTRTLVRKTDTFNSYFGPDRHGEISVFEEGKADNAYQTFYAGNEKWLVMNLELWPRTSVIRWAKEVVEVYSDYNVIIATHSYLNADGSLYQRCDYGSNSPQFIYDGLIKKYPNIKLVFCGHTGSTTSRIDTGENGNKIVTILGCFHSSTKNPVQLCEINTAEDTVSCRFYSPIDGDEMKSYSYFFDGMDFIKSED